MKRVVIALTMGSVCGRRKMAGILKYLADTDTHWDIVFHRFLNEVTEDYVRSLPARGIDGVIYSCPDLERSTAALSDQTIPLVMVDLFDRRGFDRRRNVAFIQGDSQAIGRRAAEFFLGQGRYRSFAFVPDVLGRAWSGERQAGFVARLSREGVKCEVHRTLDDYGKDLEALGTFLEKLPKPAAVFAAYDDRALRVLETCRERGLSVPRDVGVVSVDNDEVLCQHTTPTLTSLQVDHFRVGYRAAELLSGMMSGRCCCSVWDECVGVLKLVERESASPVTAGGRLVQRALAYVADNACKGISADDVAAAVKCSRRLLDLRFHEQGETTVAETIRKTRLEEVRRLLADERVSKAEAAERCAFASVRALNEFLLRASK